jgi:glycosyltransferase involved in cell wall biosynthesis
VTERTPPPLVSVVMPVFNAARYLREALDSVYGQDYRPFEVIVVDDGSTDGSGAIAQSYPGVRYLRQENRGPAEARNAGIDAALGEIVAFADADDVLLPGKLSAQVGYLLDRPETAATLARQVWIEPPPGAIPDAVWGDLDGVPAMSLVVWRQALLDVGGFDPSLRGPEDTDLLIRLRQGGFHFVVLPEIVMRRRYHGGNLVAGAPRGRSAALMVKAKLDRERSGAAQRKAR